MTMGHDPISMVGSPSGRNVAIVGPVFEDEREYCEAARQWPVMDTPDRTFFVGLFQYN